MVSIKRSLDRIENPEELRRVCLTLVDLIERQKQAFKEVLSQNWEDWSA